MAKVQFNCRLDSDVRDRIVAIAESSGTSQAEVVEHLVMKRDIEEIEKHLAKNPLPKLSKKAAHVAALKASDPLGAERDDIEHGNMELPSGGSVALVGAAIPANYKPSASMSDWRLGRKPILKPSERNKK